MFMLKNTKFYDILQKNSFEDTNLQCYILKTDFESLRKCTVHLQKETAFLCVSFFEVLFLLVLMKNRLCM